MGAYFDWLFALNSGPAGLKFYPGVGPELYFNNGIDIAAAGDFGVEYSFDFPLTIGLCKIAVSSVAVPDATMHMSDALIPS